MPFYQRLAFSHAALDLLDDVNRQGYSSCQRAVNRALYHAAVHGLDPSRTADLVRIARFAYSGTAPDTVQVA